MRPTERFSSLRSVGLLFGGDDGTVALFIAGIGAVSVVKAVYIDRRDLRCACIGGDSRAPLGFVALLENLMMVGMATWTLAAM